MATRCIFFVELVFVAVALALCLVYKTHALRCQNNARWANCGNIAVAGVCTIRYFGGGQADDEAHAISDGGINLRSIEHDAVLILVPTL